MRPLPVHWFSQWHTDIPPFVLYALPEQDAHLCSVRALSAWIKASGITQGYLFRKITSGDRISDDNIPMVRLRLPSVCFSPLMSPTLDADSSAVPRAVSEQSRRCGCGSSSLWNPLFPTWWLSVPTLRSAEELAKDLRIGWLEHGVPSSDHHEVPHLSKRRTLNGA